MKHDGKGGKASADEEEAEDGGTEKKVKEPPEGSRDEG